MTILIIYGGTSPEHDVSLLSYLNIKDILLKAGFEVKALFITKDGHFTFEGRSVSIVPGRGFLAEGKPISIDVILPLVHGNTGEDGKLQGLLEFLDFPYISEGVTVSAIGMDKLRQTEMLKKTVPCLKTEKYTSPEDWTGCPLVMKPCFGGSSIGIHILTSGDETEIIKAADDIRKNDPLPLMQSLVPDARELELLAVRDTEKDETLILGPVEIRKPHSFLSYEDKYSSGVTEVIPSSQTDLTEDKRNQLKEYARKVFDSLGGEVYMRIDFFMDRDGNVFFNEINTVPGMTKTSHFITLADEIGIERLFRMLINASLERKRKMDLIRRSYE